MINVRQTKDLELVQSLNKKIFPADVLPMKSGQVYWLAWLGNEPVGFAACHPLRDEPDAVFFSRAGLLPQIRGFGLHKRLIQTRINYCKRKNYRCAVTYTIRSNYPSANSLIRCGFKLYEPSEKWAGDVLYFYLDF